MSKMVFIVDDNDVNRFIMTEVLEDQYNVISLPSAEKMFAKLESVVPDLILMDIEMPDMGGFEAIQKLKENADYADIPVIFVSSLSSDECEIKCFELGATDLIARPFNHGVFRCRVNARIK